MAPDRGTPGVEDSGGRRGIAAWCSLPQGAAPVAFDATEGVLALPLEEIWALSDRRESTDALAPAPGGEVVVVRAVLAYFGVSGLHEIDECMLRRARAMRAAGGASGSLGPGEGRAPAGPG